MNRRGFLKVLALAPAVAAAPALALETVQKAAALELTDLVSFFPRPDYGGAWMGYAVSGNIISDGTQYEFRSMFDREPDERQKEMFCQMAEDAFERAKKGKL